MARYGRICLKLLILCSISLTLTPQLSAQLSLLLRPDAAERLNANTIPFEYFHHYIFVTLTVNGTPGMQFLFDTGTSADILNLATSKRLGLKPESIKKERDLGLGNDKVAVAAARNVDVKMGTAHAAHVLAIVDLHGLALVMGHRIDGILGFPVLHDFIVELDFKNQTLTLLPIRGYKYHGSGETLYLRQSKYYATIPVMLENGHRTQHDATLEIDTGSGATLLLYPTLVHKAHVEVNTIQPASLKAYGVGGYFHVHLGTVRTVSMGNTHVASLPVYMMDTTPNISAKLKFGGVVGTAVLEKYQRIVFDVPAHRVMLERDETMNLSKYQPMPPVLTPLLK